MQNTILVLNDRPMTIGSLLPALKSHFADCAIRTIPAASILSGALEQSNACLLVLPGINGEISPYTALLGAEGLKKIHDFAQKKTVLALCAGSCAVSRETLWTPEWAARKSRNNLTALFNGRAHGPVASYGRQPGIDPNFGDVTVVPVRYKKRNNQWVEAHIAYGNGPALLPFQADDPTVEILARFRDVPEAPAAIVRQQTCENAAYLLSVLPDLAYRPIAGHTGLADARRVMTLLQPVEEIRKDVWNDLTARLRRDMKLPPRF